MVRFEQALSQLKHRTGRWPDVSCVAFIKLLSEGMEPAPDYSIWEAKSEARCLGEIKRMPGNVFTNYIECHRKALGPGWIQVLDDEFLPGDIVFAETASGRFVEPGDPASEIIEWQSISGYPATLFPDENGKFWMFLRGYGAKLAVEKGEILAKFRRKSWQSQ